MIFFWWIDKKLAKRVKHLTHITPDDAKIDEVRFFRWAGGVCQDYRMPIEWADHWKSLKKDIAIDEFVWPWERRKCLLMAQALKIYTGVKKLAVWHGGLPSTRLFDEAYKVHADLILAEVYVQPTILFLPLLWWYKWVSWLTNTRRMLLIAIEPKKEKTIRRQLGWIRRYMKHSPGYAFYAPKIDKDLTIKVDEILGEMTDPPYMEER